MQKYRREKKLRKAAEAAAAAAVAGNSEATFEKEVKEFAEKNRMNVDVARGLIELAAKRSGVPKEVLADIEATRAERRNREYWADQRKKFDKDFNANVVPVLRSQGADDAKIREVYGQMNGSFDADGVPQSSGSQGWAWGKANKGKSLVELALAVGGGKTTRHSSEGGSRGRTRSAPQKDPGEMSGDDINSMSDEEFDSFSDGLGKQTRSVVHRS
ncbi:MAG: hypothetical protein KGI03_00930 [Patescibacteria group bacterium]|nr:hypothetical protein [Patescibacteria group bacterium]